MRNKTETGIDTCSFYYTLTSKQKSKIFERLKKLPGFRKEVNCYAENTYSYSSDYFAKKGVKIWVQRNKGSPWGLMIVIHPTLVLGNSDRSALYQPQKKQEYKQLVKTVDSLLETVCVPCSVDKMKLYREDVTANLVFDKSALVDEYIRILKKSCLLPHYRLDYFHKKDHKAKDFKTANKHSHKQYCKSAAFFAYDKTSQLEMIDAFPDSLINKRVLRLETQIRRKGMKKWLGKDAYDNNWCVIKKLGKRSREIMHWYLGHLQPGHMPYIRYRDAMDMLSNVNNRKTRERMQFLLRKTSDSETLTAALEKLQKEYSLSKNQCRCILKKFIKLGISPITLKNNSDYDEIPPIL